MIMHKVTTLNQFIIERQAEIPGATGEFSRLLHHIGIAAKKVHREVNKGWFGRYTWKGGFNQRARRGPTEVGCLCRQNFMDELRASGECCGVATEENQDIVVFEEGLSKDRKYIICMDPLDGSSNIDVNVSVGTIFSIYKRISPIGEPLVMDDFFQPGTEQVAAGYVIYGSSTMLVYTSGNGVNGFTLDTSIGEFCLSHPNMQTPESGKIYSINEGNYVNFPVGVKKFIKYCQEKDEATNRPYTSRYIGSLVADFHRNMLKGGVFLYPQTSSHPTGKLRLLYECNPMAFIAEQSGGLATDGEQRILEIKPEALHQQVPLYTGSKKMVQKVQEFLTFFNNI